MSSLKERMKCMPRVILDIKESKECVLQINMGKLKVAEQLVCLDQLEWNPSNDNYTVTVRFTNIK